MKPQRKPCPECQLDQAYEVRFCGGCGHSFYGAKAIQAPKAPDVDRVRLTKDWQQFLVPARFYVLLLFASLLNGLLSRTSTSPWMDFLFWIPAIVLTIYFTSKSWNLVKTVFKPKRISPKDIMTIFLACLGSYLFLTGYFHVFELIGVEMSRVVPGFLDSGWPIWSIFVMVAVFPGVVEEVIFRGVIQAQLIETSGKKEALVLQAALFSVLHLSPFIFISHFVMGLLVGWIRLRVGHIYYGILLHILWNSYTIYCELLLL